MSHAAFCVVRRRGQVLAISRGHDVTDWNIPGGKLEPGESFERGAVRELAEETGVLVTSTQLRLAMRLQRPTGEIAFFDVVGPCQVPSRLRSVPFEGYVRWCSPEELLAPSCRYRADARVLLGRLGLLGAELRPR